jgi:hypothetical protein
MWNTNLTNERRKAICFYWRPGPVRNRGTYFFLKGDYENAMGFLKDKIYKR